MSTHIFVTNNVKKELGLQNRVMQMTVLLEYEFYSTILNLLASQLNIDYSWKLHYYFVSIFSQLNARSDEKHFVRVIYF